jgi:hypothetical protein
MAIGLRESVQIEPREPKPEPCIFIRIIHYLIKRMFEYINEYKVNTGF